MEVSSKERRFYMTTLPIIALAIMYIIYHFAPWADPNQICEATEIVSELYMDNEEDVIFKIGDQINLTTTNKEEIEKYSWYFSRGHTLHYGGESEAGNLVSFNSLGEKNIEVKLNDACTVNRKITITDNCFDGEKNGTETGIDCGGKCPIKCDPKNKSQTARANTRKKPRYQIFGERNVSCGPSYTYVCKTMEGEVDPSISWVFDDITTVLSGNPHRMIFDAKESRNDQRITAFKNRIAVASFDISVICNQ